MQRALALAYRVYADISSSDGNGASKPILFLLTNQKHFTSASSKQTTDTLEKYLVNHKFS